MRPQTLLFLVFVGVAFSASPSGWKSGTAYKYHLTGRTLTTILQAEDSYAGVALQGTLELRLINQNRLSAKLQHLKYAPLHIKLPGGWNAPIPENSLDYKTWPITQQPFEIQLKNGLIDGLVVSGDVPTWELNILKAVASLLQVDTEGQNLVRDSHNAKPNHTSLVPNAAYRTMEDSITGKCEVLYDVAPFPPYLALSQPHLVPLVKNVAETPIIEVVKTQNFSNCDRRIVFNYGFPGISEFEHPDQNQVGDFLSRSSVSRILISGNIHRYTIQSSVTTNKVLVSPIFYNKQKAMVVGSLNLTLASLKSASGSSQLVANRKEENSLAYTYENAFGYEKESAESVEASRSWKSKASSEELPNKSGASSAAESSQRNSMSGASSSEESNEASLLGGFNRKWSSEEQLSAADRYKRAAYMDSELMSASSEEQDSSRVMSESSSQERSDRVASRSQSAESASRNSKSSSSSEEFNNYLPLPTLANAPSFPMLPLFAGISGKSIAHKVNPVETIRKLTSHIARDVFSQDPMVKLYSLSKFAILTEVIRTMSLKQLQSATSSLYYSMPPSSSSENESQNLRLKAWVVYRDAVAQAGTSPALMVIKDWIQNYKVKGEEAAELIDCLPSAAMTPTPEYLNEFFKLATSSEVRKQPILNMTAILEFTNLLRLSQIDNATAHKYYPVHVFGNFSWKVDQALQNEYIPYLAKSLKEAVARNDSVKIQVLVRAAGNVAHPKILQVFEPYLEKQKYVTTFQRTLMVVAMNQLAKLYPEVARNVLFKIYLNPAEAYEVRSAAVFLLFATNPPAAMLQRLAEFTNYEANPQVKSAVISGILSRANLKGPAHREIARAARSAVNMLNTTAVPKQFTSVNYKSYESEQLALGYSQTLNYISSYDSIIPKAVFYNVTRNIGGFKHSYFSLGGMTSSVKNLLEVLKAHVGAGGFPSESSEHLSSSKWSAAKIREILNMKPSLIEPIEGNLMLKFAGITRYLAFDESSLENLPELAAGLMSSLSSGRSFNFTKFYNQFPAKLAFPMATGLPFVYALKTPSVMSVGGKAHLRTQPDLFSGSTDKISMPRIVNLTSDLDIWYASKVEAEIGFITPFDSKHYIAGMQKNIQFNLPIKAKLDVDLLNASVYLWAKPIHEDQQTTVFHYSSIPGIGTRDIPSLKLLREERDYEEIQEQRTEQSEKVYGEKSTGMAFSWSYASSKKCNSQSNIFEDAKKDPWMLIYYPVAEDQVTNINANWTYRPELSSTNSFNFSASYASKDEGSEQASEAEVAEWAHARHKKSTRHSRQSNWEAEALFKIDRESSKHQRMAVFLDQVDSGARGKSAMVVDLSAEFEGHRKVSYVTTAAYASSPVDENSHLIMSFYKKPLEESERPLHVFLNVTSQSPNVPLINFKEAQKADPFVSVNASLYFGNSFAESSFIAAQAKFNQSEERRQYVIQHALAQQCESEMNVGNNVLPACRNVTAQVNYMDQLELLVDYRNLPTPVKNATYRLYSWVYSQAYPYIEENVFLDSYTPDHIRLVSKLYPDLTEMNVSMETPIGRANMQHWPLGPIAIPLLAVHPVYQPWERLSKALFADQFNAKCSVGASAINTFDNSTYPIHLGNCWHVLLVIAPKQNPRAVHKSRFLPPINDQNDVAILVRDADSQKKEVKIIAGQDVVDIAPSSLVYNEEGEGSVSARIQVNDRSLKVASNNVTNIYNNKGSVWAQIYFMEPSALKLRFPLHGIKMVYDGASFQLSANDSLREGVRGLCGTFDSDPWLDFTTPNGKLLNDSQLFAAIYSVPEECQGPASSLRRKALQKAVVSPRDEAPGPNVIDMPDILGGVSLSSSSESQEDSDENIRGPSQPNKPASLHLLRTTVFDEGSEVCFSLYPLPACSKGARPSARIEKSIPVYCLPRKNPTAKKLKAMIDNGLNPDLRRKGATKYLKVSLPKSCVKA